MTKKPTTKKPAKKAAAKTTRAKKTATKAAKTEVKAKKPAAKKATKKTAAPKPQADARATALLKAIIHSLDDAKAENVVTVDLVGKSSIADFLVIASGRSSRQVTAMSERLSEDIRKLAPAVHIEGKRSGDWVLVDAGDVIVHLFRPEVREFYNLEKMWSADIPDLPEA